MATTEERTVVTAERLRGGALIVFSGGETAIYSAALLYSVLSQADTVQPTDPEDEQDGPLWRDGLP